MDLSSGGTIYIVASGFNPMEQKEQIYIVAWGFTQ